MSVAKKYLHLSAVTLIMGCFTAGAAPIVTAPTGYTLERVVILSRHGVRSPTKQTQLMNDVTPDKWPQWPVKAGYLTPRGAELVTLMGGFMVIISVAKGCCLRGVRSMAPFMHRQMLTNEPA